MQAPIFQKLNEGIHVMFHGQKSKVQSKVRRLFLRQRLLYVVGYDFDCTCGIWHWSTARELLCQGEEFNEDQGQKGWEFSFTLPLQHHLPMLKYQDISGISYLSLRLDSHWSSLVSGAKRELISQRCFFLPFLIARAS